MASYGDVYKLMREVDEADRRANQREQRKRQRDNGGWTKKRTGYVDGYHQVTFREGKGNNSGHTIISDGKRSRKDFDRHHDHYGKHREDDGRVEDYGGHRGHYTGPGC